jgi:protein gp37
VNTRVFEEDLNMPTKIEWSDETWNPVTGCTKISSGCDTCYAERFAERFRGVVKHPFASGFDLKLRPERLWQPLNWRRPRLIFVNSMSDLFHKDIPIDFIDAVFDTMEAASWHTFQVLTKRSSLMRDYLRARYTGSQAPAHIWCECSARRRSRYQSDEQSWRGPIKVRPAVLLVPTLS